MAALPSTESQADAPSDTLPDAPHFRPTRRQCLTAGALAAAALAGVRPASANDIIAVSVGPGVAVGPIVATNKHYNPGANWDDPALRLVRRVTLGLTAQEAQRAASLGYNAYLEYQLNAEGIDDTAAENYVGTNYPLLSQSPHDLRAAYSATNYLISNALVEATLFRSLYSQRQLFQRMVELWSDHFNIWVGKNDIVYLKAGDDRNVIRANALGKFPDMLRASAHSPAMLQMLDNISSRGDGKPAKAPNQNYARELMELHTLGVDGGYTQTDVLEVARCFTGWSMETDSTSPNYGMFKYIPGYHDNGAKTVLGHLIPATTANTVGAGITDGDQVLNILASHPSTALFVAGKMTRWLLRYDPSPAFLQSIAQVYLDTGGDIKAMIRAILPMTQLMQAPAKYKRPYHLLISSVRATAPTVSDPVKWLAALRPQFDLLGQTPFQWQAPNGYPDALGYWAGLILPRWNFGINLANNGFGGGSIDITALQKAATPQAITDLLDATLFGSTLPVVEKNALVGFLASTVPPPSASKPLSTQRIRDVIGLALASPNFQWY